MLSVLERLDMRVFLRWVQIVAILLVSQGCSFPDRLAAVPHNLTTTASVPGMTGVRFWMDADPEAILGLARKAQLREKEFIARSG